MTTLKEKECAISKANHTSNILLVDRTKIDPCTSLRAYVANYLALRLIALHQLVRFDNICPRIDRFDH